MEYDISLLKENELQEYQDLLFQLNNYKEEFMLNDPCLERNIYVLKIDGKIVSSAKLLIEKKLYQSVGHIEDVVTHSMYRNKGLGKYLIKHLIDIGINKEGCYKVILSCKDELCDFYTKCGLERTGLAFSVYK